MNNYIPFLKLKGSEISALKSLDSSLKSNLIPFFDFPKKKPKKSRKIDSPSVKTVTELFANDLVRLKRKFEINLGWLDNFYLDNFDIEDSITYNNQYNYAALIQEFGSFGMIPVIGLDRLEQHLDSVIDGLKKNHISNQRIAIRISKTEFDAYRIISQELFSLIEKIKDFFIEIDIIFDCRVCKTNENITLSKNILNFIKIISASKYNIARIIVTGSSIPPSISEIVKTNNEVDFLREELKVYQTITNVLTQENNEFDINKIFIADYGCVSPEYSDVELFDEDMDTVTTAKIIYPYNDNLYIIRGGQLKKDRKLINKLADVVKNKDFYRGHPYSFGDKFLHEKSLNQGKNATAASIICPLINLHLTYMLKK